jgi:hypothetical protein
MTDFEPLREMGTFTEDMFNRIIAFQEREHPAWNTELSFAERIQGLPLHNLIFSNPDRDPAQYGPTVAAYYPLREEMQKIAHYVKQTAEQALLCDLYPGNGFIGSLIGREGIEVVGLQQTDCKPNQIEAFYDSNVYRFSTGPLAQQDCDAVLVSWPPSGLNPTPTLLACQPRLLIYIFTDHAEEASGVRQTGSADMFDRLNDDYLEIDAWAVERPRDLLHEVWPDMTPSIAETRQVRIYAHRSLGNIPRLDALPAAQPYDWEKDLQMALLALQAKQDMQARGFPV